VSNLLTELETRVVIREVRRVVRDPPYSGNISAAARACPVPQPTLARLFTSPPRRLTWKTFCGIWELDPNVGWEELVVSPAARKALELWHSWVDGQVDGPGRLPRLAQVRLARIPQNSEAAAAIREFRKWVQRQGHGDRRLAVALRRALGPLFVSYLETGAIERHLADLAPGEIDAYVTAALQCERILLDCPPAEQRARERYPTSGVERSRAAAARWQRSQSWQVEGSAGKPSAVPSKLPPAPESRRRPKKGRRPQQLRKWK
jgi:hypothetical protein